jgi:hypothetical protein
MAGTLAEPKTKRRLERLKVNMGNDRRSADISGQTERKGEKNEQNQLREQNAHRDLA